MKTKPILIQLGNPFDTSGARLIEAFLVATTRVHNSGVKNNLYLYNRKGEPWIARASGNTAPDFEEGKDYSTCACDLERAETTFGISAYWLKNNWWLDEVKELSPEPIDIKEKKAVEGASS